MMRITELRFMTNREIVRHALNKQDATDLEVFLADILSDTLDDVDALRQELQDRPFAPAEDETVYGVPV